MKPVRLPLHPGAPSWRHRLLGHATAPWQGALAAALLATATAAFGHAVWQAWDLQRQAATLQDAADEQARAARAARRARPAAGAASAATEPQALTAAELHEWSQIVQRLDTPWASLFDALERATPRQVALIGIEPQPASGGIRIQAEARTLATLLDYAAALRATPPFTDVLLVKHETQDRSPQQPVRLTLEVRLKPGARP